MRGRSGYSDASSYGSSADDSAATAASRRTPGYRSPSNNNNNSGRTGSRKRPVSAPRARPKPKPKATPSTRSSRDVRRSNPNDRNRGSRSVGRTRNEGKLFVNFKARLCFYKSKLLKSLGIDLSLTNYWATPDLSSHNYNGVTQGKLFDKLALKLLRDHWKFKELFV